MDSLVVANADENETAQKLRITLSTAFDNSTSYYVRCFINKLRYGVTYSNYIEDKIKKLEAEFVESSWRDLQKNYKNHKKLIEDEVAKVDQVIDELVDINSPKGKEENIPEIPSISPREEILSTEKKEEGGEKKNQESEEEEEESE